MSSEIDIIRSFYNDIHSKDDGIWRDLKDIKRGRWGRDENQHSAKLALPNR